MTYEPNGTINSVEERDGRVTSGMDKVANGMFRRDLPKLPDMADADVAGINKVADRMLGRNQPKLQTANDGNPSSSGEGESLEDIPDANLAQEFLETIEPYVTLTPEEKSFIFQQSGIISRNGGNAQEWVEDYLSVNAIANSLGISRTDVINYRAPLLDYYLGIEDAPLKFTWAASLINSFKQGQRQNELADAQERYRNLFSEGIPYDSEYAQHVLSEVQQKQKEMEYYSDATPHSWIIEKANQAIQQVPYSYKGFVPSLVANLVGNMVLPGSKDLLGKIVRTGIYYGQFAGAAFYNMLEAGVSPETAYRYSAYDGIINAINEAFLDVGYDTLSGIVSGSAPLAELASSLIPDAVADLAKKGALPAFLLKLIFYMGLDSTGEFLQESTQELTSWGIQTLAEKSEGLNQSRKWTQAWKDSMEAGIQGWEVGMFFGLGGAAARTIVVDIPKTTMLRNDARQAYSKEAFVKNEKNRDRYSSMSLKKLSDEDIDSALGTFWDRVNEATRAVEGIVGNAQEGRASGINQKMRGEVLDQFVEDMHKDDNTWDRYRNAAKLTTGEIYDRAGNVISGKRGEVQRMADGKLFYVQESNGDGTYTMKFGNPGVVGRNGVYEAVLGAEASGDGNKVTQEYLKSTEGTVMEQIGEIRFRIDDKTGALTIEGVAMAGDDANLMKDAVNQLREMYGDYGITWNAQSETEKSVYDSIVKDNPRGEDHRMNYTERTFDSKDKSEVERWLGDNFSRDANERSLLALVVMGTARRMGMSGMEFIDKYIAGIERYSEADAEKEIAADWKAKGKTSWTPEEMNAEVQKAMANVKGGTKTSEINGQVKATIYAGEHADPTTFMHELDHLIMLLGDNMSEFTELMDKVKGTDRFKSFLKRNLDIIAELRKRGADGKYERDDKGNYVLDEEKLSRLYQDKDNWTREEFEVEARLAEAWRRSGKTLNPEMKGFFRRIAEIMRNVYYSMRNGFGNVELNDEVVEFFDRLYGYDANGADKGKDFSNVQLRKIGTLMQTAYDQESMGDGRYDDQILEERQQVVDKYKGTDQWMKAPNGKATNLSEDQWITVRTQSFINWFGDWLNDPQNASMAVDENGEPMVFYHGSYTDDIEVFRDQGYRNLYNNSNAHRSRGGASFTSDKSIAESYAEARETFEEDATSLMKEIDDAVKSTGAYEVINHPEREKAHDKEAWDRGRRFFDALAMSKDSFWKYENEEMFPEFQTVYWFEEDVRGDLDLLTRRLADAINDEFPEESQRIREARNLVRSDLNSYEEDGYTNPKVYEVFLRVAPGTTEEHSADRHIALKGPVDVSKEKTGSYILHIDGAEDIVYISNSNDIKSATDNNGHFDENSDSILRQIEEDDLSTKSPSEQYNAVKEMYRGTSKYMMAPNGMKTSLTERQWVQVRTPAFKEWFGDWENDPQNASKVLDDNGEPLVMYHGTFSWSDFDRFDIDMSGDNWNGYASHGKGFYFTSSEDDAFDWVRRAFQKRSDRWDGGATVMPVFLNIRNPFTGFMSRLDISSAESLADYGYDGYFDDAYGEGKYLAVATDANQIKSATDNNGAFSQDEDSILRQVNNTAREHAGVEFENKIKLLKTKYQNVVKDKSSWDNKSVNEFFKAFRPEITRMLKEYPRVNIDGLDVIAGISQSDIPFLKEFYQAKFVNDLSMGKTLLIPRYTKHLFQEMFGVELSNGSLSEGLLLLGDDDKYIEFKFCNIKRFVTHANTGFSQGDIVFAVIKDNVTDGYAKNRMESVVMDPKTQGFLAYNISTGTLLKKGTVDSALEFRLRNHSIPHAWKEDIETFHLDNEYTRLFDYVNKNSLDNTMMDYEEYSRAHDSRTPSEISDSSDTMLTQKVNDPETVRKYETEETITTYRAMQKYNGQYYSPMAKMIKGKPQPGLNIGDVVSSEGHPEYAISVIDKKTGLQSIDKKTGRPRWQFPLEKGEYEMWPDGTYKLDKKGRKIPLITVPAAYNPYIHSSLSMLNDQFSTAYKRPNLVVVEVQLLKSDVESGFWAEKAKDPVGATEWKAGPVAGKLAKKNGARVVYLSTSSKLVREVPASEVAQNIKGMLDGTDVTIPDNVVTPSLLEELKNLGVPITESEEAREWNQYIEDMKARKQETSRSKAQAVVDESMADAGEGSILNQYAYHGSGKSFQQFLSEYINSGEGSQVYGWGLYFSDSDIIAKDYASRQGYSQETQNEDIEWHEAAIRKYRTRITELEEMLNAISEEGSSARAEAIAEARKRVQAAVDRANKYPGSRIFGRYHGLTEEQIEEQAMEEYEDRKYGLENSIRNLKTDLAVTERQLEEIRNTDAGGRQLYKVELPDEGWLDWNGEVSEYPGLVDKIVAKVREYNNGDDGEIVGAFRDGGRVNVLYAYLQDALYNTEAPGAKSDEKASRLLNSLGYVGFTYEAGKNYGVPAGAEGATNFVVFNQDDVQIVDHWNYQSDDEGAMLRQSLGIDGATRLDSLNLNAWETAMKMDDKGKPMLLIKMTTGWEKNPNGEWTYEIPDGKMVEEMAKGTPYLLPEVYDNPELFKAYPKLADLMVVVDDDTLKAHPSWWGYYNERTNILGLSSATLDNVYSDEQTAVIEAYENSPELADFREKKMALARKSYQAISIDEKKEAWKEIDDLTKVFHETEVYKRYEEVERNPKSLKPTKDTLETIIHEIQHYIQHAEGFAPGGAGEIKSLVYKNTTDRLAKESERYSNRKSDIARAIGELKAVMSRAKNGEEINSYDFFSYILGYEFLDFKHDFPYMTYVEILEKMMKSQENSLKRHQTTGKAMLESMQAFHNRLAGMSDQEFYTRLLGEMEARANARRMNLSPDERKRSLVSQYYDVKEGDAIVLKNNMSAEGKDLKGFFESTRGSLKVEEGDMLWQQDQVDEASTHPKFSEEQFTQIKNTPCFGPDGRPSYNQLGRLRYQDVATYLIDRYGLEEDGSYALFYNRDTDRNARFTKTSVNKIVSIAAARKSLKNGYSYNTHNEVAMHCEELYRNAKLVASGPDKAGSTDIDRIERYESYFRFNDEDEISIAYFTVKGHTGKDKDLFYSVELKEIKETPSKNGVENPITELNHTWGYKNDTKNPNGVNSHENEDNGSILHQTGDSQWMEDVKRILAENPSDLEGFISRVKSELGDDADRSTLEDIYSEVNPDDDINPYDPMDDIDPYDPEDEVDPWNPEESVDDDWTVEEEDVNYQATSTDDEDLPDWMRDDYDPLQGGAVLEEETDEEELRNTLVNVQATLPNAEEGPRTLDNPSNTKQSASAKAAEFGAILVDSKEETRKFLRALRRMNDIIFSGDTDQLWFDPAEEPERYEMMKTANEDLEKGASQFIRNLVYVTKGSDATKLENLSDRNWKIVAGQVAANASMYMDLYYRATGDENWAGYVDLESRVKAELGIESGKYRSMSFTEKRRLAEELDDIELKEKLLRGGNITDEDLRGFVRRQEARLKSARAELEALEVSSKYAIDEKTGEVRRLSVKGQRTEEALAKATEEHMALQDKLEKEVARLERKIKGKGLETTDTQVQSELRKKVNSLERRIAQLKNLEARLRADGTYFTEAGVEETQKVKALIDDARKAIEDLEAKEVITPEEAVKRLGTLYGQWRDDKVAKAVYDAETRLRWMQAKRELERKKKEAQDEVNRRYLERRKLEKAKEAAQEKAEREDLERRWIEAKKRHEEAIKRAQDAENEEYVQRRKLEKVRDEERQKAYDRETYLKWMDAKRENERKKAEAVKEENRRYVERRKLEKLRDRKNQEKAEAIRKLKEEYRKAEAAKRAAKKLRAEKEKLARQIMRKPSDNVHIDEAEKILALQETLDPAFRKKMKVDGNMVDINDLKAKFRANPGDPALSTLTEAQLLRIAKKSLDEMTLGELEQLAETISNLRSQGLQKRMAYVLGERQRIKAIQNDLIAQIRASEDYREPAFGGGDDEARRKKALPERLRSMALATYNMARKAQMMDGDKKGAFYDLLVRQKRACQDVEMRAQYTRTQAIREAMAQAGVKPEDLYGTVNVKFDFGTVEYSVAKLGYVYLANNNVRNREAVSYGVLVSDEEKRLFRNAAEKSIIGDTAEAKKARADFANDRVRQLGDARWNILYGEAEAYMNSHAGVLSVVKAIEGDFNSKGFDRVVDIMRKVYNVDVERDSYYLPNNRDGFVGTDPAEKVKNDLMNTIPGTKGAVEKGFTKSKIDIPPIHQSSVNMDLFQVWQQSVRDQEHLLSTVEYVRTLNGVFENKSLETASLRDMIKSSYGDAMMEAVDMHLKEIADPDAGSLQKNGRDELMKLLKGNVYSAYLGFKLSAVTNQLITSPAAFLGKVGPVRLGMKMLQFTTSWKSSIEKVHTLSAFMRSRNYDIIAGEISENAKNVQDPKLKRTWAQIQEFGLKGLEFIDEYCVSAGWLAIYEQEIERLGGLETAENVREAVKIADEYVMETQPLSDKTELAPMFKNKSEAESIFFQFQSSLNVVWQNVTYDVPKAFKNHAYRMALGTIVGYMMAGALLGLAHGDVNGKDDDEDRFNFWKFMRRLLHASTTQFTEGVPLVSNTVENVTRLVMTGDKPEYMSSSSDFPAFDKTMNALLKTGEAVWSKDPEDLKKALEYAIEGTELTLGLPYSMIREVKKIPENGIGALVGYRK